MLQILFVLLLSVCLFFADDIPMAGVSAPELTLTPTPPPIAPSPPPPIKNEPLATYVLYSQVAYSSSPPKIDPVLGKLVDHQQSVFSGFSATVFRRLTSNNQVEYVVAFRGSEPLDPRDWFTDLHQAVWIEKQYVEAVAYARSWVDKANIEKASVTFVGHSLGGGLSEYAGLKFGRNAICFNAAALGLNTILSLGSKERANESHVRHIVMFGDSVFFLTQRVTGSRHFGSVQLLFPSSDMLGRFIGTLLKLHDIDTIKTSLQNGERLTEPMSVDETLKIQGSAWQKHMTELLTQQIKDSLQDVKGVRIHFDERIFAEVIEKGAADKSAKLINGLTSRLSAAKSESERTQAVATFEDEVKRRFLELRDTYLLHDLVALSLRSLVASAERYKGDWDNLPVDLRQPGGMTRIHGFVIAGDDILLIGIREPGAPVIEIDDLIVGVQSVWKENAIPLVSLDPDLGNIGGDPNVRIQGVADDSSFAMTMLEADYAMKKIMAGVDSVDVPGYRTLKDTLSKTTRTFISRFWLYPVQPRIGDIRVSSDASSVVFIGAVRILSEEMLNLKEGLVGTGQTFLPAEEAADSFTAYYEKIAVQRPIFKRLQSLFDVVLMSRIWHVRGLKSTLLDRLCALPHCSIEIPRTYPAIRILLRRNASSEYYLQGGVQAKIGAGRRTWLDFDDHRLGALHQSCQRISNSGDVFSPLAGLSLNAAIPSVRPDSSGRDFTAAVTNLFRGDLKAALAAADRLLTHDSYDSEALILRALIQMRRGDYASAQADAKKARDIDPEDRETAAAASEVLFQCAWIRGDPESALREIENGMKDDLQRANGQVSRGEALALLDKPDEARKAFLKALELDPACAVACARLAQLELAQGRTLAAKPWVQKGQALDADLPAIRIASAQWELATVRPDLAEKIAGEVWETLASSPTERLQALAILTAVSASREKWDCVDNYVALMDKMSASSPEVLVTAAEIAMQWGERERALMYIDKAVRLSPRHPLVLKMRLRLER